MYREEHANGLRLSGDYSTVTIYFGEPMTMRVHEAHILFDMMVGIYQKNTVRQRRKVQEKLSA